MRGELSGLALQSSPKLFIWLSSEFLQDKLKIGSSFIPLLQVPACSKEGKQGKTKTKQVVIMSVFTALLISTKEGAGACEHENIKIGMKNTRVN